MNNQNNKHLKTVELKNNLITKLISEKSKNDGLIKFRDVFHNDFMEFANEENTLANEAQMTLRLQALENYLQLSSAYPPLHTKTQISVGGGFSAGKSEFISSFIDGDIKLPIGVVPTTAIPCYVSYDEDDKFIGCTNKGGVVKLNEIDSDFHSKLSHEFISSFGFNLKDIMPYMIIGAKTQYEYICFLDTPGYDPADLKDTYSSDDVKIAKESLQNSNIFIWLIGADTNGTIPVSDLEFLESLELKDKKLFVVLNKADLKPLSELQEILEEIEVSLDDYNIEVEGISAFSSITKEEVSYKRCSLFEFLDIYNKKKSHRLEEAEERLREVYKAYKQALKGEIKRKKQIQKTLHSISLNILEKGNDEKTIEDLTNLKKDFDTTKEEKELQKLKIVKDDMVDAIDTIFANIRTQGDKDNFDEYKLPAILQVENSEDLDKLNLDEIEATIIKITSMGVFIKSNMFTGEIVIPKKQIKEITTKNPKEFFSIGEIVQIEIVDNKNCIVIKDR